MRASRSTHPLTPSVRVVLLDVDPDLATGVSAPDYELARRRSVVRVVDVDRGRWDPGSIIGAAGPDWLGLLVLDGVLLRCVAAGHRGACEILGEGDIVRPWDEDGPYEPLAITITWTALGLVRLAVLDDVFAARVARWPAISAALMEKVARRARMLTLQHAAAHLPRIDSRLLVMFWLLADRWGKVTPDGVLVTLAVTHRMLATALGSHRPSITVALQQLARDGLLIRQGPNRWLLTTKAIGVLGGPPQMWRNERSSAATRQGG